MTIRIATIDDIPATARVGVESWRTTYAHLLPAEFLAGVSVDSRAARDRHIIGNSGICYFVADDPAAGIVGFINGGPLRADNPLDQGEVYALYLLANFQRRGIGTALAGTLARKLYADAFRSMRAWVLTGNPSIAFYEQLGGTRESTKQINIGGVWLEETCLMFEDLPALFEP